MSLHQEGSRKMLWFRFSIMLQDGLLYAAFTSLALLQAHRNIHRKDVYFIKKKKDSWGNLVIKLNKNIR